MNPEIVWNEQENWVLIYQELKNTYLSIHYEKWQPGLKE